MVCGLVADQAGYSLETSYDCMHDAIPLITDKSMHEFPKVLGSVAMRAMHVGHVDIWSREGYQSVNAEILDRTGQMSHISSPHSRYPTLLSSTLARKSPSQASATDMGQNAFAGQDS